MLALTVLAVILIASGVFDPAPLGSQRWTRNLSPMSVARDSREIQWLDEKLPQSPFTFRLNGAYQSGEVDSGYGLVLGDETAYLAVAVSPTGYLAIWEATEEDVTTADSYLLNWQTWPHVHSGSESNEIWLDVSGDRAAVRINREWLWEGEISALTGNVGLLGESFGETAVIDFERVEFFSDVSE